MTPNQIVRRVVELAREYAERGNYECARRLWRTAEWHARRCGGISGTVPGGGIVLDDGFVAWSPIRTRQTMTLSQRVLAASIAQTTITPRRKGSGLIRGFLLGVGLIGVLWLLLVIAGVE